MTNLTTLAAAGLILAAGMAQAEGKYGTTAIQAPAPAAEIWLGVHRENRQVPRVRAVLDCIAEAVRGRAAILSPVEPVDGMARTEALRDA